MKIGFIAINFKTPIGMLKIQTWNQLPKVNSISYQKIIISVEDLKHIPHNVFLLHFQEVTYIYSTGILPSKGNTISYWKANIL